MKPRSPAVLLAVAAMVWAARQVDAAEPAPPASYVVYPIGRIQKTEGRTLIVLDKKYEPGLLGLNGFSHVLVFWWFDKNDTPARRSVLQVHPRGNPTNPLTGVFATRSPVRPNLIGLTLCRIIAVKDNTIEIEKTDAFDGTPVLDLKPFLPACDAADGAAVPRWASEPQEKPEAGQATGKSPQQNG